MRTELQPALPTILGSESEIRDALTNLIFNAVDAMPDGGTLDRAARAAVRRDAARAARGRGYRRRHGRGNAAALPGALLHDQGRARHRPRPRDGLRHGRSDTARSWRSTARRHGARPCGSRFPAAQAAAATAPQAGCARAPHRARCRFSSSTTIRSCSNRCARHSGAMVTRSPPPTADKRASTRSPKRSGAASRSTS